MPSCTPRKLRAWPVFSFCLTVATASPLMAQVTPQALDLERRVEPGPSPPPLPEFLPEEVPSGLEMPPLPRLPPARGERLSESPRVLVSDIRLEGNTVFSDEQLASIISFDAA